MLYQAKWTVSTYKIMTATTTSPPERSTYRHGDLRRALLEAGIQLARAGGPDAVVLREATRRAGVVPNAAYRHFASRWELLQAVRSAALSALAVVMEAELARLPRGTSPAGAARANLRAIGTAYLRFAQEETGLFHTAFAIPDETRGEPIPAKAGNSGLNPFQLLGATLDRLVDAGVLPPERRPGAEYLAWAAVRGLAMLLTDGPLRSKTGAEMRDALDEDDYDIVVIDVTQPGHEDGFALAEIARDQGCGPILVTGDHRHLERLQTSGQHYLLKPFRVQHLVEIVDKILVETVAKCVRRKRGDGSFFPARIG